MFHKFRLPYCQNSSHISAKQSPFFTSSLGIGVCLVSGKNVPYQNFGLCLDGYKLIGMPMATYPTLLYFLAKVGQLMGTEKKT